MKLEENTRQRILKAALDEFSTYGLSGARMDRIARAAKINKAMIFYYFASKENLYRLTITQVFSTVYPKLAELFLSSPSATDFLDKVPLIYIDLFSQTPQFVKMIAMELIQNPQNVTTYLLEVIEEKGKHIGVNPRVLQEKISRWYDEGQITEPDPFHFMLNIVSLSLLSFLGKPLLEGLFNRTATMEDFRKGRIESVTRILKQGMLS